MKKKYADIHSAVGRVRCRRFPRHISSVQNGKTPQLLYWQFLSLLDIRVRICQDKKKKWGEGINVRNCMCVGIIAGKFKFDALYLSQEYSKECLQHVQSHIVRKDVPVTLFEV